MIMFQRRLNNTKNAHIYRLSNNIQLKFEKNNMPRYFTYTCVASNINAQMKSTSRTKHTNSN